MKNLGCSKSNTKRQIYSITGRHQETRKISNSLTFHLKKLEKNKKKTHSQYKERHNKNQSRIKLNRKQKHNRRIKETKSWLFKKIKLTNLWL